MKRSPGFARTAAAFGKLKFFAFCFFPLQSLRVKKPLVLVLYEKLMPGSRLVNRLQDEDYRVLSINDPERLLSLGNEEKPLLIFADLVFDHADVCSAITRLRQNSATAHIPVVAFGSPDSKNQMMAAQSAGATLVVTDAAVLAHLPQLLELALQVE